jgi:hypothetical protein
MCKNRWTKLGTIAATSERGNFNSVMLIGTTNLLSLLIPNPLKSLYPISILAQQIHGYLHSDLLFLRTSIGHLIAKDLIRRLLKVDAVPLKPLANIKALLGRFIQELISITSGAIKHLIIVLLLESYCQ